MRFLIAAFKCFAMCVTLMLLAVGFLRVFPIPLTPAMILRIVEGGIEGRPVPVNKSWVPYEKISPNFMRAVVAAEDARFMRHNGIDWKAVENAQRYNRAHRGQKKRGASTITMQTAKNAFLWHGRTWLRKGLESWFTLAIEHLWGKRRILEVYANIVEFGDGIYGVEAASREYFQTSAESITKRQAALLAAVLPNPHRWSPAAPTNYINRRVSWIQGRMGGVAIPK